MAKTIAILGVDGTGKSSVINEIKTKLGDSCIVQYMGYRSFGDKRIEQIEARPHGLIQTLVLKWLIYKSYIRRYREAKKKNKIVIFDRYVHEIYINSFGLASFINKLVYKYLYPNPNFVIYLHCPAEISLARKDDIPDKEVFKSMKTRFDSVFIGRKKCLCLDSYKYSSEQLADIIIKYINDNIK